MTDPITRLNAALEGRYSIDRKIGEGGMATVYLAEDAKHERKVALKVLKPELSALVGAERFLTEIKTTANLQHPHILPLHDSGEADGFLYFVAPYVEGDTLRDKIDREKQLGVDEALEISKKVAAALDYAHKHGVVHRDIKPGNILLSAEGDPILADFGIALAVAHAGGNRVTETGLSLGTPHYMSPEQATGDRDVDLRTDVYALGCVLYEMLTGDPPYQGSNVQSVLAKILTEDVPIPTRIRAAIPRNVDAAIRRALEKLPADRFSSAQDFSTALADPSFSHGEEPAGVVGGRGQWTPVAIVATGLAIVLAMNLGWTLLRTEPLRTAVRFQFFVEDIGALAGNAASTLDVSPDGSKFVFLGGGPPEGQLWQRRLDQLTALPVPGTAGARAPRLSPDGESVVFKSGNQLVTASLSGDVPPTAASAPIDDSGFAWGPDGMLYFIRNGDIWRVPAAGGEEEPVTTRGPGEPQYVFPDVLPNGKGILFTRLIFFGAGEIAVLSLETGEISILFQGAMARYSASGHILYTSVDGSLSATPFDEDRFEVTGPSQSLAEGIQMNPVGASVFAVSETGVLLYRTVDQHTEYNLQIVSFSDATETIPLPAQNFNDPRWSPDGRSLAYASGPVNEENIYVYDVEQGTAPRQLTFEGSNIDPVWSQDGSRLAFASLRDGTSDYDLFVKAVNEDTFEERILQTDSPQFPRQWLASDVVIFEGSVRPTSDLWQVSASGGEATPYIESENDLDDVAVSPDGRWAVYQSDETGVEELYVRSFPAPRQQIRVSEGGAGGQFPRWSPDGSAIYYWSAEGLAIDTLYAATVATEPTFTVLSREIVHIGDYSEENWDLHPSGDRIVAAQPSSPTIYDPDHLFVVLNLFEELR